KSKKKLENYIEQAKKSFQRSKKFKIPKAEDATINTSTLDQFESQFAVLELFEQLGTMNDDLQKISKIMSGHNKIHVNPFVLERQIKNFKEVMADPESSLNFNEEFRNNPDLKNYLSVAEEALKHLKKLSPVYRGDTKKVLENI